MTDDGYRAALQGTRAYSQSCRSGPSDTITIAFQGALYPERPILRFISETDQAAKKAEQALGKINDLEGSLRNRMFD